MDNNAFQRNIAALAGSERNTSLNAAQVLLEFTRSFVFFQSPDGQAYASCSIYGHRETWPIPSKQLRMHLTQQFVKTQRKPPPSQALQDALGVLEAQALMSGMHPVFLRVAGAETDVFLDLGDEQRKVAMVSPTEWKVVQNPRVHFMRPKPNLALPCPIPGGSLEPLRELLNVQQDDDWRVIVGWLLGALRPEGPYPILILQGEHGTAKSTVAKVLKFLVDPSVAPLRTAPRSEQDLLIAARRTHILAFDNLSGIPAWFSDALCRLSTGGSFATRELYSDAEETILHAERPVILNGIDDLAIRQDLIDRAIVVTLPTIPDSARRQDRELWKQVVGIRPAILGALLTAIQHAVANHERITLSSPPRMADFATWMTAAESGLNWNSGAFLQAYRRNRGEAIEIGFEASPVAGDIRTLMDEMPRWEGTAKDLLTVIMGKKTEAEQRAREMPQTPQAIRNHLQRLAPALRSVRIEVTLGRREARSGRRLITIEKKAEIAVTVVTPPDSHADQDGGQADRSSSCDDGDKGDDQKQAASANGGFPLEIPNQGKLRRDALSRCAECDELTSFSYGGMHLCVLHARMKAQAAET